MNEHIHTHIHTIHTKQNLSPLNSGNSLLSQDLPSAQLHRRCHPLVLPPFLLGSVLYLQLRDSETATTDSWMVTGWGGCRKGKRSMPGLDMISYCQRICSQFEIKKEKPKQFGIVRGAEEA